MEVHLFDLCLRVSMTLAFAAFGWTMIHGGL